MNRKNTSSPCANTSSEKQWHYRRKAKYNRVGYGFFSQTFYQNLLLFRVNVYNNYNLQLRWADDKYK